MALRIEDYALIGDCLTAALVGRDGSIDWLCLPRFDSGACFAALLGTPENGRWLLAPQEEIRRVRRSYREGTLILETDFETESGAVTVVDCMPPRTREPNLIRMVIGRRGQVRMRMELIIRFDYGSVVPWVRRRKNGISAIAGPDAMALDTPVPVRGEDFKTVADFTVAAGQEIPFVLLWHPCHENIPKPPDAGPSIREAEKWWKDWSSRCVCPGPW